VNGSPRRSAGFTLVEILLAMGLLVVVLAGVYAGLETFRRVTTMGRDAATEQQLARAIRARLLTDLRSVRFAEPRAVAEDEDETSADDASASSMDDEGVSTTTTTPADDAATATELEAVPQVGLIGDPESLTLYVELPARPIDDGVLNGSGPRMSDLRTVTWFLAGRGGAVSTALAADAGTGLARSEGDTSAIAAAEALGNLPDLIGAARVLAPEVTGLRFRYYDGADWLDVWDSSLEGALPRAVEATLEIDLDGPPNPYALGEQTDDRAPTVTRVLVCPPLSEPSAEAVL